MNAADPPRVVVVSGAGTGIGLAVARAFAADSDRVVLIGRRRDVLAAAAADLGDPEEVERARAAIVARFGAVDVLVNSAGGNAVLRPDRPGAGELSTVLWDWSENLRANTLTAVLLTEALKPHLVRPGGRVVLLSSIAAYRGSGSGSYGAAKAALHPYAYDLANELSPQGITVNVVAPGYIEDTEFFRGGLTPEQQDARAKQALTGRAGTPADVAATVRWLASSGAAHITAQIIQVNGGAERGR